MKTNAVDILVAASDAIQRNEQRGADEGLSSMERTVTAFKSLTGHTLSEGDGWVFMAIFNMALAQAGQKVLKDYVEGAACMALAGESLNFPGVGNENE